MTTGKQPTNTAQKTRVLPSETHTANLPQIPTCTLTENGTTHHPAEAILTTAPPTTQTLSEGTTIPPHHPPAFDDRFEEAIEDDFDDTTQTDTGGRPEMNKRWDAGGYRDRPRTPDSVAPSLPPKDDYPPRSKSQKQRSPTRAATKQQPPTYR
ncbi:hypothetical protein BC829DRAFT_293539 [Chytridium lagenaria]|nr:hypothetical protein BC829DRAFT_293539 [Chytridium lagenaria]